MQNKPAVEYEVISKDANSDLNKITATKRRFVHHWVDFKRALLTDTIYKNFHRGLLPNLMRLSVFGAIGVGIGLSIVIPLLKVGIFIAAKLGLARSES